MMTDSPNSVQGSAAAANETAGQATARSARTGYADVDGGRIDYQVHGDLNSGKTPLLVLHGSFMSGDAMRPLVEPFAASRPVIAIDARGHGRTGDFPGSITYELLADDAAAVLAALNVRSADVLGYSMGGTTAIFMAIRHPDRVGKQIILAGTYAARRLVSRSASGDGASDARDVCRHTDRSRIPAAFAHPGRISHLRRERSWHWKS